MCLKRKLWSVALALLCSMTATKQLRAEMTWKDCSDKVLNNDFNENAFGEGHPWQFIHCNEDQIRIRGVEGGNQCLEVYSGQRWFDVLQEIEGLTPGYYVVRMQGFYRSGQPELATEERRAILYAHGTDDMINYIETPLRSIFSGATAQNPSECGHEGCYWQHEKGYIPTTQCAAAAALENGRYPNELMVYVAENGKLTIGVRRTENTKEHDWFVMDKVQLFYVGTHDDVVNSVTENDARYFRNVATGKFMNGGAMWQTSIVQSEVALDITPIPIPETGKYLLDTKREQNNNKHEHFVEGTNHLYMDAGAGLWTMEPVGGNKYVLTSDEGSTFLGADGTETGVTGNLTDKTDPKAQWELLTKEQMIAELKNATKNAKKNATFLLPGAHFKQHDARNYLWNGNPTIGGANDNNVAEKYDVESFDVYQVLEGVPNGYYEIKAQGFYRAGSPHRGNLTDAVHNAYLYANDKQVQLPSIFTHAKANAASGYVETAWGYIPDAPLEAATDFMNNEYNTQIIKVHVTDNTLRIGVKKDRFVEGGGDWTVFDNIQLSYYAYDKVAVGNGDFDAYGQLDGDNPWKIWGTAFTYKFDGDGSNTCLEVWNGEPQPFDIYQKISGLTPGYYVVKMQGFFRDGGYAEKGIRHPILYAHLGEGESHVTTPLRSILSGAKAEGTTEDGNYSKHEKGYIPNTMSAAATAFANGEYPNELIIHVGEGKDLYVGVKRDKNGDNDERYAWSDWTVIDKFELFYLGSHDDVMATAHDARYFRNVGSGKFLNVGGDWESCAMLYDDAIDIRPVHITEVDKYLFDTRIVGQWYDHKHYLGTSQMCELAQLWSMEEVSEGRFAITYDNGSSYIGYDGSSDAMSFLLTDKNSPNAQWEVLSHEQMIEEIKCATAENKANATFLLPGSHFTFRNERCWNGLPWQGDYFVHGSVSAKESNSVADFRDPSNELYQVLEGVPNGFYEIRAQGFYRGGSMENITTARNAYLYANNEETPLLSILAGAEASNPLFDDTWEEFYEHPVYGWLPANQPAAARLIYDGKYKTDVLRVHVTDNTLRIGVKKKATIDDDWTVIDNIDIHYYGSMDIVDGSMAQFAQQQNEEYHNISYTRNFNGKWQAFFVPFEIPVDEDFLSRFDVAYINDLHSFDDDFDGTIDRTTMEIIAIKEGTLNANHPYLIKSKKSGKATISVSDALLFSTNNTTSINCSSAYVQYDVYGTYAKMTGAEVAGHYGVSSNGGWTKMIGTQTLSPFRLWMKMTTRHGSPIKFDENALKNIRIHLLGEDGSTTEVNEVEVDEFFNPSGAAYDLMGRPVKNPGKGIYIINGKKVLK